VKFDNVGHEAFESLHSLLGCQFHGLAQQRAVYVLFVVFDDGVEGHVWAFSGLR